MKLYVFNLPYKESVVVRFLKLDVNAAQGKLHWEYQTKRFHDCRTLEFKHFDGNSIAGIKRPVKSPVTSNFILFSLKSFCSLLQNTALRQAVF